MSIAQELPLAVEAPTDEPTCRHGYQCDEDSPEEDLRGYVGVADEAHRLTCPRAQTFWHPRWEWLDYVAPLDRLGMVVCCIGCGEQVT